MINLIHVLNGQLCFVQMFINLVSAEKVKGTSEALEEQFLTFFLRRLSHGWVFPPLGPFRASLKNKWMDGHLNFAYHGAAFVSKVQLG